MIKAHNFREKYAFSRRGWCADMGRFFVKNHIFLTSVLAIGVACPAIADSYTRVPADQFPKASLGNYMQPSTIYEHSAIADNMDGVYEEDSTVYAVAMFEALICNANQYLADGASECSACPTNYPYSDGEAGGITRCYGDTQSRPWTGSQVDGEAPTGCTVTSWNSCSKDACDYVSYSNADGSADGNIKTGCASNNANCAKTPKTVSANNGYYAASGATSCTACPTLTVGYNYVPGTGWTNYGQCVETKSDTACASGTLTKTATSATEWGTAVSTLRAYPNKYVTGTGDNTTCVGCPSAYPNSVGTEEGVTQCYSNTKLRPWTGSQLDGVVPIGCTVTEWNSCSIDACPYVVYSNADGSGEGTLKEGCATNNANCTKTVKSVSANNGYYAASGATSCTACPTLTSGYSYASGTGWTSFGQCKEIKNGGAHCASGNLSRTAKSATAWDTVVSTLKADSGAYVDGDDCTVCPSGYPNSAGTEEGVTQCYSNTKLRSWTGSQLDGVVPEGAVVTEWNECSIDACSYVVYSNAAGTGDGTLKEGCSTNAANCTKTIKSLSAKNGYYCSDVDTCTACPTLTSGYTYASGTGWTSFGQCKEIRSDANCVSGTLTKTASSATKWGSAVSTLKAAPGDYVSGSGDNKTCSACPAEYPYSDGGTAGISQCYFPCPEKTVANADSVTRVTERISYVEGMTPSCTYNVTCSAGYVPSGNGTANPVCNLDISTVTCGAGEYLPVGSTSCAACPSAYPYSDGGNGDVTQCYSASKSRQWTGSQLGGVIPDGCVVPEWNSCSKAACSYVAYSNATGNGDGAIKSGCATNDENCTQTPKTLLAESGYYMSGNVCAACPSGYPNSDGGNGGITQCYSGTKSRSWNGNQLNGVVPTGCTVTEWNSCSKAACNYVAYSNATGNGDGAIKSGCSTNEESCTKTVKSVSAKNGYFVASDAISCTACPSGYPISDGGNGGIAQCYYNCPSKTVSHSNSVTPVVAKIDYVANQNPVCTYNVTCESGYTVAGNGTANPVCNVSSVTCVAGKYLPYGQSVCAICPEDNYCGGVTAEIPAASDKGINSCPTGLVAPQGTKTSGGCGKRMFVGSEVLYLTKDKQTTPALAVKVDGKVYYAKTKAVSSGTKPMNGSTSKSLRVKIDGVEYSIYDNTVQGE